MSSEERQREVRRAGFEPAEAEEQERAKASRERKRKEDARLESEGERRGEEHPPLAEDSRDRPRPRR